MRRVGDVIGILSSRRTFLYKNRLLSVVATDSNTLLFLEFAKDGKFNRSACEVRATIAPNAKLCLCSIGSSILSVVYQSIEDEGTEVCQGLLIDIDFGPLSAERVHVKTLQVSRRVSGPGMPSLCRIGYGKAVLTFAAGKVWACEPSGETLNITEKLKRPIGPFPYAGLCEGPDDTALLLVSLADGFAVESITWDSQRSATLGILPHPDSRGLLVLVSTIVLGERFLLVFGGLKSGSSDNLQDSNSLYIMDLKTKRTSVVRKEGNWHSGGDTAPLYVAKNALFLLGGDSRGIYAISLPALTRLTGDSEIRSKLYEVFGTKEETIEIEEKPSQPVVTSFASKKSSRCCRRKRSCDCDCDCSCGCDCDCDRFCCVMRYLCWLPKVILRIALKCVLNIIFCCNGDECCCYDLLDD